MALCPTPHEPGGHHEYATAPDGKDYCIDCGISFAEASAGFGVGGDLPGKNAYNWKLDGQTPRGRAAVKDGKRKKGHL